MSPTDSDRIAALEARVVELEQRLAAAEDALEDLAEDEDDGYETPTHHRHGRRRPGR